MSTPRARGAARPPPVAVEQRHGDGTVHFHFPVEIHIEAPQSKLDLDRIAEHVYARLARRLGQDA